MLESEIYDKTHPVTHVSDDNLQTCSDDGNGNAYDCKPSKFKYENKDFPCNHTDNCYSICCKPW